MWPDPCMTILKNYERYSYKFYFMNPEIISQPIFILHLSINHFKLTFNYCIAYNDCSSILHV